jgi:hypothetical protein
MEGTGEQRGASALQWIAVGVAGLMLALVVWGTAPWEWSAGHASAYLRCCPGRQVWSCPG